MRPALALLAGILFALLLPGAALAQAYCVKQHFADPTLGQGIAVDDALEIVAEIGARTQVSTSSVQVIACDFIKKAQAWYSDGEVAPSGEYIIYEPIWVREVVGKNRAEAILLFAHELGHLLNRHQIRTDISDLEKEVEADRFAGCAAARLGVTWDAIETFFSRIRGEVDTTHPSRFRSLDVARAGFDNCGGEAAMPVAPPVQHAAFGQSVYRGPYPGDTRESVERLVAGTWSSGPDGSPLLIGAARFLGQDADISIALTKDGQVVDAITLAISGTLFELRNEDGTPVETRDDPGRSLAENSYVNLLSMMIAAEGWELAEQGYPITSSLPGDAAFAEKCGRTASGTQTTEQTRFAGPYALSIERVQTFHEGPCALPDEPPGSATLQSAKLTVTMAATEPAGADAAQ